MSNSNGNYETFFSNWVNHQKTLLQQLLQALSPQNPNTTALFSNLIDLVLSHYTLYYHEKGVAATEDPFLFFNPPWLTAFERTLLWFGDFKPSLIFKLINRSVTDLTEEQSERIEHLRAVTKREERKLADRMAGVQESLASVPLYSLARRSFRLIDGEVSTMDEAVEALKAGVLAIMEKADVLRGSTAANAVEILNPVQGIRFLAAAIHFQLETRRWGQQRASASNVLLASLCHSSICIPTPSHLLRREPPSLQCSSSTTSYRHFSVPTPFLFSQQSDQSHGIAYAA